MVSCFSRDSLLFAQRYGIFDLVASLTWLFEQLLNAFAHNEVSVVALPFEFTVPPVADVSLFVDQVHAWPHGVPPDIPISFLVIDNNGEIQALLFCV